MKNLILTLISTLLITAAIFATPYITPEQWRELYTASHIVTPPVSIDQADLKDRLAQLQDQGFAYLFEYIQICDFLDFWQVADTNSINFGGMIEGETGDLVNIIQTDNTQESIRVWSHYAALTGDPERYRQNIADAWTYTMNFPAYSEEGETDYYRVHNCGWGLVAQIEFETVFNDSTYRQYADSSAEYIVAHPLSFTQGDPYYQQLHPLVTGWAAGTLYQYGLYRSNPAFVTAALNYGQAVKTWIEANPYRLSQNEVWAMSGGTAMWGVVNSLFRDDSTGSAAWLAQYLPYMDTYSGPGQWNNSWNIWYAHAYYGVYDITGDSLEFANGVFLTDTLLHQDTDNDGGVPAGSADPDSMDQTWISCYTDYMGIANILNLLPQIDVGVSAFINPPATLPISLDQSLLLTVQVSNFGQSVIASAQVTVSIPPVFTATGEAQLLPAASGVAALSPAWQPPDTGFFTLTACTSYPGDENSANDTLSMNIEVRGSGTLFGTVSDANSGQTLPCSLYFYHQEISDSLPYASYNTENGNYSLSLMAGIYRIEILPSIPYNIRNFISPPVFYNTQNSFDIQLTPAVVLLVDDDGADWLEIYYYTPLQELNVDYYYWDTSESGSLNGELSLFPACIWFTGDESAQTLTAEEKNELTQFLLDGGCLLLTGQNIGDDLGSGDPFMNQYLKADHYQDDVNQYFLDGVPGQNFFENTTLFLIGSPGAGNQDSPASCINLPGGEAIYRYQNAPNPAAAVACQSSVYGYKSLYFSFGLEGISGLVNTTTRAGLLQNIFAWWGFTLEKDVNLYLTPETFILHPPYPNPFNSSVRIAYSLPAETYTDLTVYNLRGQEVARLWAGRQSSGNYSYNWNAAADNTSGIYFCRLQTSDQSYIRKLILLK